MKEKLVSWIGLVAVIAPLQSALALQWGEQDELDQFVTMVPNKKTLNGKPVTKAVTNARTLDALQLKSARLPETPWSSDFWPDEKGSIADPYSETGNGKIRRIMWNFNRKRLLDRRSLHEQIVRDPGNVSAETIDSLSPSEKYDMLVGDDKFSLSHGVVDMVEELDKLSLIAPFSGVCHGWGPASLTMPRPEHTVTLQTKYGHNVTFYPDDIKALASFLWGKSLASDRVLFEGTKCYSGKAKNKNGRMLDPKCFNVNPAFFHLVAANQIGINQLGFIFDRKSDKAVWNHPAYRYEYSYYNVAERRINPGKSLDQAKVFMTSNTWDPYGDFRSPKAHSIVGVQLKLWYGKEDMKPSHRKTNDPSMDHTDMQVMHYDLELDSNDNIVGGEWREWANADQPDLFESVDCTKPTLPGYEGAVLPCENYTHPNSVWLVPPGTVATSGEWGRMTVPEWNGKGVAPKAWTDAAQFSSSATIGKRHPEKDNLLVSVPNPQPLSQVVDLLIKLAREKQL